MCAAPQKIVESQAKRRKFGRDVRPLRCVNTEWMGGIDWRLIESRVTGLPLPKGLARAVQVLPAVCLGVLHVCCGTCLLCVRSP